MDSLINHLISVGVLKSSQIINAFCHIDRADFVPEKIKKLAYQDSALPIGHGQTISQPYTVVFMLELLSPKYGENILDIGYGSGWQTALLAYMISNKSQHIIMCEDKISKNNKNSEKIFAIETMPELCEFGKNNIYKFNFIKKGIVKTFCKNGINGLPEIAEKIGGFDKIIAAASLSFGLPSAWKEQLKIGGVIVVPILNSIFRFVKKSENKFEYEEFPGFAFVPFIS